MSTAQCNAASALYQKTWLFVLTMLFTKCHHNQSSEDNGEGKIKS